MQRVVFLVDMNAFFISCEMTRNPNIVGKPAAVAGDPKNRSGIILAANYEARKYGVKTAMVLHEALKLCPNMLLVPPDHGFYEQKSEEVMNLLSSFSPVIEQNSIDEAWLDMSGCEALFGKPIISAQAIMDGILNKLGLMCSIGISENRFLAKMASDMKKPLGITQLWKENIPRILWPLPVGQMYGVGKQTSEKLQNLGIETIGQLAHYNRELLFERFGKGGIEMHQLANGIDLSSVTPHHDDEMKSIGRSTTLRQDISDIILAEKVLLQLSDEVGMVARKYDKKGRTVQITIKYSDFKVITRQMKIPATYLTKEIYSAGIQLLQQNWNPHHFVRLIGISLSNFNEDYEIDQISMFQSSDTSCKQDREERLEKAMDRIKNKHGLSMIKPAILVEKSPEKE